MKGNVLVGQSGGPTAVINSSLAGVFKTAMERGFNKVYGMRYGIQGFMDEQYVDLSDHIKNELDLELLKRTPSAFLGTCRYKLPEIHEDKAVYERIFELLDKLDIEVFIYIGGNDSMDTIRKLFDYSLLTGAKQKFVGCPKTIDNDLAITDHTPGFGSAAKYIATSTKEIICDAMGFSYKKKNVNIVEIMGRNAGWLTGAAALSRSEDCEGPDLIYLPEVPFSIDGFVDSVKKLLEKKDVVVAVVSEGIKTEEGKYVCEYATSSTTTDAFRPHSDDRHRRLPGQRGQERAGLQDPRRGALHPAARRGPPGQQDRRGRSLQRGRRHREGGGRRLLRRDGRHRPRFRRSLSERDRRL